MLLEIRRTRDQIGVVLARHPGLRATLAPVVSMHQSHIDALVGAVPKGASATDGGTGTAIPAGRVPALRRLAQLERELSSALVSAALKAESGAFARLLASMATAIDERLAGWPR
jgi:hypothetical protein